MYCVQVSSLLLDPTNLLFISVLSRRKYFQACQVVTVVPLLSFTCLYVSFPFHSSVRPTTINNGCSKESFQCNNGLNSIRQWIQTIENTLSPFSAFNVLFYRVLFFSHCPIIKYFTIETRSAMGLCFQ